MASNIAITFVLMIMITPGHLYRMRWKPLIAPLGWRCLAPLVSAGAALLACGMSGAVQAATPSVPAPPVVGKMCGEWPAWTQFKTTFMSPGGRIVDPASARNHTVSEAQAYGLFFALVGNDRAAFDLILKWTEDNLAAGDLTARLPAWQWGKLDNGMWGVVDPSSAADADLWMVHALGEAARLWGDKRYMALASVMADRILREEVVNVPGLGPVVLPGPRGFQVSPERWRLNPSYYPVQQFRWLAKRMRQPAWARMADNVPRIIQAAAPKGFAADWLYYDASGSFAIPDGGDMLGRGSFDAIRVYLWAGTLAETDPARRALLKTFAPLIRYVDTQGYPPESINTLTLAPAQAGPSGFSAAVMPLLKAAGEGRVLQTQRDRLEAKPLNPKAYYEQALAVFATGSMDGYYRFGAQGQIVPKWHGTCKSK
jgi:endoglucanase